MALTKEQLFRSVRSLIRNIPVTVVKDEDLEVYCEQAIRRVSEDRPRIVTQTFVGDGGAFYKLADSLNLWVDGLSTIQGVWKPAPTIADDDQVSLLDADGGYAVYDDGTGQFIRFASAPGTGVSVAIRFSTVWAISGIDGAVTTSVPSRYENAVECAAASVTCRALASQYAGVTSSEIPGDLINYRTKSREYSMMADKWEEDYKKAIGIATGEESTAAAAISRAAYDSSLTTGHARVTHHR